ncbi:alpha/beta hydrolase [Herbiconiux liangxiaofengii]|uniref:alpha/beta hydrolase n=1 Tax=Herbiconiux liangxiaofengii TaxID=3342795 RepID=UPI0035B83D21
MARGWAVAAAMAAAGLAVAGAVRIRTSPWPSVRLIRAVFDRDAAKTVAEMERHAPAGVFRELRDVPYDSAHSSGRSTCTFDLVAPVDADGPLPVVVWIHGGAWISGSKAHVAPYLRHFAAAGCIGVAIDYTIAPEAAYPTAVQQLDDALAHLVAHSDDLGIDPTRIVLAGDSAGAQLASQLTAAIVDPSSAARTGIRPSLARDHLRGVVLHCGIYDLEALAHLTGVIEWGLKSALWAYTGQRDWSHTEAAGSMSTIHAVTGDWPPAFVSGGNGDGLTAIQSVPLSERMRAAGVDVTTLFWPPEHTPALPHEYQFHLDFPDARHALAATLDFLARVTSPSPDRQGDPPVRPQPAATTGSPPGPAHPTP